MPNSSPQKLALMVNSLISQSKRQKVQWEVGSNDSTFKAKLGDNTLYLSQTQTSAQSIPDIVITIFDSQGNPVEHFTDNDLVGQDAQNYDGFYSAMSDLYSTAGGQATGADKAVEDILQFLNSDGS